jgi:hypothetical protein
MIGQKRNRAPKDKAVFIAEQFNDNSCIVPVQTYEDKKWVQVECGKLLSSTSHQKSHLIEAHPEVRKYLTEMHNDKQAVEYESSWASLSPAKKRRKLADTSDNGREKPDTATALAWAECSLPCLTCGYVLSGARDHYLCTTLHGMTRDCSAEAFHARNFDHTPSTGAVFAHHGSVICGSVLEHPA